jgi:hypothetical protein
MPRQTIGRGSQIRVGLGGTIESQTTIEVARTMLLESRPEVSTVEYCAGGGSTSSWECNALLCTSAASSSAGQRSAGSSPQKCYAKTM